uniref:T9SS type A sorting domain-containing protein n=1 Tax=Flavobacterium sp. TaxID=239 RepID=UPI004049CFFD
MNKLPLLLFLVFSSAFSQINDDILGNWQVTDITINGETLSPLNQNVTAELIFDEDGIHPNYQSEPCMITNPTFTSENSFTLDFPNLQVACLLMPNDDPPYEPFQDFYHDFFPIDDFSSDFVPIDVPIDYDYTISNFQGVSTLSIVKENGDVLNAIITEYDNDDLFDNWTLSSVDYENQFLQPSPEIVPATLSFVFFDDLIQLNLNYCNNCYFQIGFISGTEFVVYDNTFCTLLLCEETEFLPVLPIYENAFWQNIGVENPYTYIITVEGNVSTLTITNSNGDVMVFNSVLASNANFDTSTVSLFPNPVQNELFFTSESVFENYQIFDLTGKLLQKGNLSEVQNIAVQSLPKGLYVLQLENRNIKNSVKFIKN